MMNTHYCYIDYSKLNSSELEIESFKKCDEIRVKTIHADLYFGVSKSESLYLEESENYIILSNGFFENKQDLLKLLDENSIEDILYKVLGIYSLIIYDKKNQLLYLTRDHFGLTHLFYYQEDEFVLFSNRLKTFKKCSSFKKELDYDTLGQYLQYSYIFQPRTMFKNTLKVKSANYIKIDLETKKIDSKKYWCCYDESNKKAKLNEEFIIKKSETLLKKSVEKGISNSKDIGSFLSGGYDSSALCAIISNTKVELNSYTMGFEDKSLDEAPEAKKIADYLDTKHHQYYFNSKILEKYLNDFAKVYDEPIADMAVIPTMLLCDEASKKVDTIFGGEGGDEVFASSSFIKRVNQLNSISYPVRLMLSKFFKPFSKNVKYEKLSKMMAEKNIEYTWKYQDMTLSSSDIKKLINSPIKEIEMDFEDLKLDKFEDSIDRVFLLMFKSYVTDDLVVKLSYAAQNYNLKARLPFLDREFVEFLTKVDLKTKRKNSKNKYILRKIIKNYLPIELFDRPKKGFATPAAKMLKNDSKEFLDKIINEDKIKKEGIFDSNEVMKLKKRFLNSNSHYDSQNIWNILIFELWYEEWFSK